MSTNIALLTITYIEGTVRRSTHTHTFCSIRKQLSQMLLLCMTLCNNEITSKTHSVALGTYCIMLAVFSCFGSCHRTSALYIFALYCSCVSHSNQSLSLQFLGHLLDLLHSSTSLSPHKQLLSHSTVSRAFGKHFGLPFPSD